MTMTPAAIRKRDNGMPETEYSVKGTDLPEGPCGLVRIGHEDGSVTALSKWPEGLVLWHDGVIVWKQWDND